ncbi:MAG: gamma-glutamylcyclotransferase [Polyangiaceae bacterium]|nr:gamma-glutamylcyclotransferase [Polyangiaceae bacterium]
MSQQSPSPVTFRLLAYGTFLSGEREHDLISGSKLVGSVRTAKGYTLVETRALAGLVEGGDGDVVGELYDVSYEVLRACDKRRDIPILFERKEIPLADGTRAHAYVLRHDQVRGLRRIKGGDWRQRFSVAKPEGGALVQWAKNRYRR